MKRMVANDQRLLRGVVAAMLTPLSADGRPDEAMLRAYTDWLIGAGVDGLFVLGTNGESQLLGTSERKMVAEVVIDQAAGRVPVVVQVGSIDTRTTLELAKAAMNAGADAVAVVSPYYYPLDEEALFRHYAAVGEMLSGRRLYVYNIPSNTGNDVRPSLLERLVREVPAIRGVKDSSRDFSRIVEAVERLKSLAPATEVLVGTDAFMFPALVQGADGAVSAVANCFPELVVELYRHFQAGMFEEARLDQARINHVRNALKRGPYLSPYKLAVELRRISVHGGQVLRMVGVREPLRWPSQEERERLREALETLGLIGRGGALQK